MALEDRIKQLERRCRVLSIGMICLLIAGGVFVLAAASQQENVPDSMQAKKLEIVDESGKVCIRLGKLEGLEGGGYGLSVYDSEGDAKQAGVSLGVSPIRFPSGVSGRPELKLRTEDSSLVASASPQETTITLRDSGDHIGVIIEASAKSTRTSRIIVQNEGGQRFDTASQRH